MFFYARNHRVSKRKWFYDGKAIDLADLSAIDKRLRQLHHLRQIGLSCPRALGPEDNIYLQLHQTDRFPSNYEEFIIRLRTKDALHNLAKGNSFVRSGSHGYGVCGFIKLSLPGLEMQAICSRELGRIIFQSRGGSPKFHWCMTECFSDRERESGRMLLEDAGRSLDLDIRFPGYSLLENFCYTGVGIRNGDKLMAEVIKYLNPLFVRGFRFGLWLRDEVPILRLRENVATDDFTWHGIVIAMIGIICLYEKRPNE